MIKNKIIYILVFITSICLAGCSILPHNADNTAEEFPVDTGQNLPLEQDIILNLKQAESLCIKLRDFKWHDMDGLGYWEIRQAGPACLTFDRIYSKDENQGIYAVDTHWISIYDMLPSSEQVKPLIKAVNSCLQISSGLNAQESAISKSGQPQNQLDAILKTALYLAENLQRTRKSQFVEIKSSFDFASEKTQILYLDKFDNQSASYLVILDAVLSSLRKVQQDLQDLNHQS